MDFMDLSMYIVSLWYAFSSLFAIFLRNLEVLFSIIIFIYCLVSLLESAFPKASTICASVVFLLENTRLLDSSWENAFISSKILGCGLNSTYFPRSFVFSFMNFLYSTTFRHCTLQLSMCLSFSILKKICLSRFVFPCFFSSCSNLYFIKDFYYDNKNISFVSVIGKFTPLCEFNIKNFIMKWYFITVHCLCLFRWYCHYPSKAHFIFLLDIRNLILIFLVKPKVNYLLKEVLPFLVN